MRVSAVNDNCIFSQIIADLESCKKQCRSWVDNLSDLKSSLNDIHQDVCDTGLLHREHKERLAQIDDVSRNTVNVIDDYLATS